MKVSLASKVLSWLANTLVGTPESLFGHPIGELWLLPNDRTPPDPDEVVTASWQCRRVIEVGLRRRLAMPVAVLSTVLATAVVVVGLLVLAGTMGIHEAYAKHHAAEIAMQAQVSAATTQCANYARQAATLDAATKQTLLQHGCDPTTGELDVQKFKAQLGSSGQ